MDNTAAPGNRLLWVLWAVRGAIFLDLLGFGMIIADIQLRAEDFGARGALIGGILATMFIVQSIASPLWGRLSDRTGRIPIALACTLLSALSMVVYSQASGIGWLFAARALAGLGAANVAIAQAFVSDITASDSRLQEMGRMSAAVQLGLIIGPSLGGELAARGGNHLVGTVAAAASVLGLLLLTSLFSVQKLAARQATQSAEDKKPYVKRRLSEFREIPGLVPILVVALVAWFSLATLEGTFARLLRHNWAYGAREFGYIFGFESLVTVGIQAFALGWLAKRVAEKPLLQTAYLCQGLGLALTPIMPNLAFLFIGSAVYATGAAIANPTINTLCSRIVPPDRQGEVFGLIQSTRSAGFVIGPVLGGQLFDWFPAAPYYFAGFVCLSAAFLVRRISGITSRIEAEVLSTAKS